MSAGRRYRVDAWKGMDCIAFRSVARASTAIREANHQIIDKGADRIYIYADGPAHGLMADWAKTGGWKRVDDPRLEAAIAADDT